MLISFVLKGTLEVNAWMSRNRSPLTMIASSSCNPSSDAHVNDPGGLRPNITAFEFIWLSLQFN